MTRAGRARHVVVVVVVSCSCSGGATSSRHSISGSVGRRSTRGSVVLSRSRSARQVGIRWRGDSRSSHCSWLVAVAIPEVVVVVAVDRHMNKHSSALRVAE